MTFLLYQRRTLYSLGFTLNPNESILWQVFVFLHTMSLAVLFVAEFSFVYFNLDDLMLATNAGCAAMYCTMALPKLFTMQFSRKRWYRLWADLEEMWHKAEGEERRILKTFDRVDTIMSWIYSSSCYFTGCMYLIMPLAVGTYDYYTSGNATWVLPMKSSYPYDVRVSPNYEITYLWLVQGTFTAIVGSAGTDIFFYGCALNLSGHLRIVQQRVGRVCFEERRDGRDCLSREFRDLLRYHAHILYLCEELVDVCVPFVFAQFLISSLQLCVVAVQLTFPIHSYATVLTFAFFLWSICFECFVFCHGGTKMLTESLAVSDAVFGSRWYETRGLVTRKSVQIFIARAQKGVAVKGIFFKCDLVTFSSIMSKAGSYITLLQTLPG